MFRPIALTALVCLASSGAAAAVPRAAATLPPPHAVATDLTFPVRPSTQVDSLRTAALHARQSLRWNDAARLRRELLATNPGDGFGLSEIAGEAENRGCLATLAFALQGGGDSPVPVPSLDQAGLFYLQGLVAFNRSRYASASRWLDRAIAMRPDWGWAHLYRARCADATLEPVAVSEEHFRRALRDSDAVPAVAGWLLGDEVRGFQDFSKQNAQRLHASVQRVDWAASSWTRFQVTQRVLYGTWTQAWSDSILRSVRSGPGAADFVSYLGWAVRALLAPPRALKLVDRYEREASDPGEKARWPAVRAEILADMGLTRTADSVLSVAPLQSAETRQTRLEWRMGREPASVLAAEAAWLSAERLGRTSVYASQEVWSQLGREDSVRAIWNEVHVENPRLEMMDRLGRLMRSDRNLARTYVDSMVAVGFRTSIQDQRLILSEQFGDTLSVSRFLGMRPESSVPWLLQNAATTAFEMGWEARGNRLVALALEKGAEKFQLLLTVGDGALRRRDRARVLEVARAVDVCCPGCPEAALRTAEWELELGEERRARAVVHDPSPVLRAPEAQSRRAYLAFRMGEPLVADSLSAAAVAQDSMSRDARWTRAMVLGSQGNAPAAQGMAQSLMTELPGREDYKQLVGSLGGVAQWSHDRSRIHETDPFAVLEQDLASTAWILERMAQKDTLGPAMAVILQQRVSYLAHEHRVRFRKVLKLETQQGVETYGSARIPFDAAAGPPVIHVARVIYRDGRVVDVPRGQIVIGSGREADADVADSRHLVIPFGGLKIGIVLDLAWEESHSTFGSNWSSRYFFNDNLPTRECIVEVVSPKGAPIQFQQGSDDSPPDRISVGAYDVARWTVRNLPALRQDDFTGGVYDQNRWCGFSTHRSWDRSLASYPDQFWRRASASDPGVVKLARATKGAPTPTARAQSLLDSLSNRVRYFAVELGQGRFVPGPSGEVLERGFGDCKDLVTLAVGVLEAAGIDAEPVLVTRREEAALRADLPEPERFTHMVLWTPKLRGGCYTDLTIDPPCLGVIGADYEGTLGLRFGRDGAAVPVTLPSTPPESHGYTMEIDVRPRGNGTADIEVASRYRGELARLAAALLGAVDTSFANVMADRMLGFGLPPTSQRLSWTMKSNTCAGVTAIAVYRDTAWSEQTHNVAIAIRDEVADPMLDYPSANGRLGGIRLDYGYRDTVVVRLHSGGDWEPVSQLVSTSVSRPNYGGEITVRPMTSSSDRWIEVRQRFELLTRDLPRDAYAAFHRDWLRFQAVVCQPYRYRRSLDRSHTEQVRTYVHQHPDDSGYALQAAQAILGDDMGGDGPDGTQRRAICRELLQPARRDLRVGAWPQIYLCGMAMYEGRLRAADSLALEALDREEGNMFALAFLASIRGDLGDRKSEVSYIEELTRRFPSDEMQYQLLAKRYRDGNDNEARAIEVRLASLRGSVDTSQVAMARLLGFVGAGRCVEAKDALEDLRRLGPASRTDILDALYFMKCDSLEHAAEVYERLWLGDPLNESYCNNLAWAYALLGRDLDLAEEIANITVTLSVGARRSAQNTLAVIQARRGKWSDARRLFDSLASASEDLDGWAANVYFIALCDYELGRKNDAVTRWRDLLPRTPPGEWRARTSRSLELAARGLPPRDAVFVKGANGPRP